MKKTKKLALLAALILGAVPVLTGCSDGGPAPTAIPTATIEQASSTPDAAPAGVQQSGTETEAVVHADAQPVTDELLLTVNGRPVTRSAADDIAGRLLAMYASYGIDTSSAEAVAAIRQLAVRTAIQVELLFDKGEQWGVTELSAEEMQELTRQNSAEWESVISYYMSAAGVTDKSTDEEKSAARQNALDLLAASGYTEQYLLDAAIRDAQMEKIQAEVVKDVQVTDEEIAAAYDERVAADEAAYRNDIYSYELNTVMMGVNSYYTPAGYRGVTQILIKVDDALLDEYQTLSARMEEQVEATSETGGAPATVTDMTEAVTQEQIEAARQAILASVQPTIDEIRMKMSAGTAFDDLIDMYNIDPGMNDETTRANGYSVHMDSMVYDPAFVQAAFSVDEIGQVSDPFVGVYGVYVVYYLRNVPAGPVPFEQVRSEMTEQALAARETETVNAAIDGWMAEAKIEYTDAGKEYAGE